MNITARVNVTIAPLDHTIPLFFGYGVPHKTYLSDNGMIQQGFLAPQAVVKNRYYYFKHNTSLSHEFTDHVMPTIQAINPSLFAPYDIDVVLNSKYNSHFYTNGSTIEDYQVDVSYLLSRYILRGLGIHSHYTNAIPRVVTPLPRFRLDPKTLQRVVLSIDRPTLFDYHIFLKTQRNFIWQFYSKNKQMVGIPIPENWWQRFVSWFSIGYEYSAKLYQYVLQPRNAKFVYEASTYMGMLLNDELIMGTLRLDLLHSSYCDTSEFLICSEVQLGKRFEDMYANTKIGGMTKKILNTLGYVVNYCR